MKANITIMSGDGVGPEIIQEAVKVFQAIEDVFDHDFNCCFHKESCYLLGHPI